MVLSVGTNSFLFALELLQFWVATICFKFIYSKTTLTVKTSIIINKSLKFCGNGVSSLGIQTMQKLERNN